LAAAPARPAFSSPSAAIGCCASSLGPISRLQPVRVECVSFEDWPLASGRFDLLISAQAFHWVDPAVGLAKAAAALKPNGHIALFWNIPQHPDSAARRALDEAYRIHAPELAARWKTRPFQTVVHRIKEDIDHSGLFHPVLESRFPWSQTYRGPEYLQLLSTYSEHRRLAEPLRLKLFRGVAEAIEGAGGSIEVSYDAVLYRAMVRDVRPVLASK
jgi:SAM-dependent methyltransferase